MLVDLEQAEPALVGLRDHVGLLFGGTGELELDDMVAHLVEIGDALAPYEVLDVLIGEVVEDLDLESDLLVGGGAV